MFSSPMANSKVKGLARPCLHAAPAARHNPIIQQSGLCGTTGLSQVEFLEAARARSRVDGCGCGYAMLCDANQVQDQDQGFVTTVASLLRPARLSFFPKP